MFCGLSLTWDLSGVFLIDLLGLRDLGRRGTDVKSPFCHILSCPHCQLSMIYAVGCDLGRLAEAFSGSPPLPPFSRPLSTVLFGKRPSAQPPLSVGLHAQHPSPCPCLRQGFLRNVANSTGTKRKQVNWTASKLNTCAPEDTIRKKKAHRTGRFLQMTR